MKAVKYFCLLLICSCEIVFAQSLNLDKWTYIQIDSNRSKWGDFDEPKFLRYFGIDAADVNSDGYKDIVSGRQIYLNPGNEMNTDWEKIEFDINVDAVIVLNIDDDEFVDIIAQAYPDVYWIEAESKSGTIWNYTKILELPKTKHNNGQGYLTADIYPGGKEEILLSAHGGTFVIEIPNDPAGEIWNSTHIAYSLSDEGFDVLDIDSDGDLDIVLGDKLNPELPSNQLKCYLNPGDKSANWNSILLAETINDIDRVRTGDFNGDGTIDIVVSEERWPGKEPDANLYLFLSPLNPLIEKWEGKILKTQYSMNNLDSRDIDNDGDIDIVTNEHKGSELNLQIFENDGKANFKEHIIDKGKECHLGARLSDLDNDGDLDIIGHAWDNYKFVHVWRNDAIYSSSSIKSELKISEGHYLEGQECFKVVTPNGTYYYQKEAGAFASMIDSDGNDWISFKKSDSVGYPYSAANEYRGLPNLVFKGEDNGVGHPGFTNCLSFIFDDSTIVTESKNGKWKWEWIFHNNFAEFNIIKNDTSRNYWFLYEGTPGGQYNPLIYYWGNDKDKLQNTKPDHFNHSDITGFWQWVYLGQNNLNRVMFIAQAINDDQVDTYGLLGNTTNGVNSDDGMTVFGFGRKGINPMLNGKTSFYIGFYNHEINNNESHLRLSHYINKLISNKW